MAMDSGAGRPQYDADAVSTLPPELWDAIVGETGQTDGLDPASLLALASAGRVGQQAVGAATRPFYVAHSPSEPPVLRRIPAIEYARLAANFGVTDPLALFLAMVDCLLRGYFRHGMNMSAGGEDLAALFERDRFGDSVDLQHPYSTARRYEWATLAPNNVRFMTISPPHAQEIAAAFRAFTQASKTLGRASNSGPSGRHAINVLPSGPDSPGPFDARGQLVDDAQVRMTAVAALDPQQISALTGGSVTPDAVGRWLHNIESTTREANARHRQLAAALRTPEAYARIMALVGQIAADASPSAPCRRALYRSPLVPRFDQLFAASPFLVAVSPTVVYLVLRDLHSAPIEWAIKEAGIERREGTPAGCVLS